MKSELTELKSEVALLKALIKELLAENAALKEKIADLEARLKKNSQNSSKPPSSDGLSKPPRGQRQQSLREKGKKKTGGQKGHAGKTLSRVTAPDHVITHALSVCSECFKDLSGIPCLETESRQVFDIPAPKLEVTEHRIEIKICPCCQEKTKAQFPDFVSAPVQYGSNIQAWSVYLQHRQFIPEARLQETFEDLVGVHISTATLSSFSVSLYESLEKFEASVLDHVAQAPVKHLDETGFRIGGQTQWCHVASTAEGTYYHVSPKRKSLLEGLMGVVVHDHWKPYFQLENVLHALCNAHHLRELNALIENKERWARHMKRFLLFGLALQKHHGESPISPEKLNRYLAGYDRIVRKGLAFHEAMEPLPKKIGRGKQARRTGHNLLLRFKNYRDAVLRFLIDPEVPFTNNLAEQDIRMMKCKQKISGGFRTFTGAMQFARIRGFLSTARKQGWNMMTALRKTLMGDELMIGQSP